MDAFLLVAENVGEYMSRMFYLLFFKETITQFCSFLLWQKQVTDFIYEPGITPTPAPASAPVEITSNPARPRPRYFEKSQTRPQPGPVIMKKKLARPWPRPRLIEI